MNNNLTIGVLIGNANSPHTYNLMRGITEGSKKFHVNILFFLGIHSRYHYRSYFGEDASSDFDHQFNIVYDYAWLGKVDALIVPYGTLGIFLGNTDKNSFLSNLPPVPYIILEDTHSYDQSDSITTDNYSGMLELMEHLICKHHYKEFIYLSGPSENMDSIQRFKAFQNSLLKYKLPFSPDRVAYGDFSECVEPQVNSLLDRFPNAEAFVCANDLMAYTVCKECKKRGLIPGKDIAVTGYDDWKISRFMDPPLTTVHQDSFQMGLLAVEKILKKLYGEQPQPLVLPGNLVCRASCGCNTEDSVVDSFSVIRQFHENAAVYQQETWFLPLLFREMLDHLDNEKDFFYHAVNKLHGLHAQNSYLYIFKEPLLHRKNDPWFAPDTLYLAAYHEGNETISFTEDERPVITFENGLTCFHPSSSSFSMSIFCLFCGDMQYGLLLTEIESNQLPLFYLLSMQIGNALHNYHLSKTQKETQKQLEQLIQELNEKHQILNFISEYDSMTSCLNRRGFLERAVQMNREHVGEEAYLIFADLDHLKEINDSFGHSEGDFSIVHIASLLRTVVEKNGIVARLGGDEFVALFLGSRHTLENSLSDLKELQDRFNLSDQKDYYIEVSIGFEKFVCSEDISLPNILRKADRILYLNKLKRRKTVRKNLSPSDFEID